MRIGLALPHYDTSYAGRPVSWESARSVARTAERVGLDSVWVSDHLFLDWSKYGGSGERRAGLECLTTLSALAAATEKVRLGSLTLCNDLRNPGLLAKTIATLDLFAKGRLEVGLGAGWYVPEYEEAGISFDSPGVRIARLGESLSILKRLLGGEEVSARGRFFQLEGAVVRPAPERIPTLWVGGKGDYLLKTAARFADGWNFSWLGPVASYAERSRRADELCEEAGRDPSSLRRSVGVYLLAGRDDADVARRFERLIERTPAGVLRRESGGAGVSWDQFREGRFAGTTAEVVDRLGELETLGVEEIIVTLGALPFQVADEEDVELLGTDIAPALR